MRIRRCAIVFFEPREEVEFAFTGLLSGGSGITRTLRWLALAPHLAAPVEIGALARELLGSLSPSAWIERASLQEHDALVAQLIASGLIVEQLQAQAESGVTATGPAADDARLRQVHWHPLAALLHAFTRWSNVDSVADAHRSGTDTAAGLLARHGPPPVPEPACSGQPGISLPVPAQTAFDALLQQRVTCRNFDAARALPLPLFSIMLARTFGVQAQVERGGLVFAKKNSPSGGGLHPTHACLLVQNVEGVSPGLYRYLADTHQLVAVARPQGALQELALAAVSQQSWFANAHCLVVQVAAFERTFWKYRRHDKGYRVVTLESGHVAQTLYLSATDLGLGAFITGAINERVLEQAFGLDPLAEGVMAVCGFGWRSPLATAAELDPLGKVWAHAG